MISSQAIFDEGSNKKLYQATSVTKKPSPKWNGEPMVNQSRDLEASKIVKERKYESLQSKKKDVIDKLDKLVQMLKDEGMDSREIKESLSTSFSSSEEIIEGSTPF